MNRHAVHVNVASRLSMSAMAQRRDHLKRIRRKPFPFLNELIVSDHFVDTFHREQGLKEEEEKWLRRTSLSGSVNDHRRRKNMVLFYTILTHHLDHFQIYLLLLLALSQTNQHYLLDVAAATCELNSACLKDALTSISLCISIS